MIAKIRIRKRNMESFRMGQMPWLSASRVTSLKIDPRDPGTVYALTDSLQGLRSFKSKDRGASWIAMTGSLPDGIPTTWDTKNPSTVYYSGSEGLFKSTDGGSSWRRLYSGLVTTDVNAVAIDPQNPGSVYAFTRRDVFKSTDGARRWNLVSSSSATDEFVRVVIDPQNSRTIYQESAQEFTRAPMEG